MLGTETICDKLHCNLAEDLEKIIRSEGGDFVVGLDEDGDLSLQFQKRTLGLSLGNLGSKITRKHGQLVFKGTICSMLLSYGYFDASVSTDGLGHSNASLTFGYRTPSVRK